jgi:hypothetical protein
MLNNVRHHAYLKFATACITGAFMSIAGAPTMADEQFALTGVITLPDSQTLSAFDISFVSPENRTLAIAASRVVPNFPVGSPFGVVIIADTNDNVVIKELQANPPFAGACSFPARNTVTGPNGVIVIEKGGNADVWVGDGPVLTAQGIKNICSVKTGTPPTPVAGDIASGSTVKVLDLRTGGTKAVIPTGGNGRADELCYNPQHDVVLMANDEPFDNFITFIGEDNFKVIQKIRFDGTDPNAADPATGKPILANGIEQCVSLDGKFYLNIPNTGAASLATPLPGVTVQISGHAPFKVEKVFDFSKPPLNATGCTGGTGLAVGPDHQLALACGLIIDARTGHPVAGSVDATGKSLLLSAGPADEVWYNPGNNHYFFADSTPMKLGVVDAGFPPHAAPSLDSPAPTAAGSHSVAADPRRNQVYVPIRGNNGVVPAVNSKTCSSAKDVFGIAGSDALGCIGIYTAPGDKDDRRVRR